MTTEHTIRRYRRCYAKLLRFYSKPYHERFGESMEQTFADLLRERSEQERGLTTFTLWMFADTLAEIIRENPMFIMLQKKDITDIALATGFILLLPLLAMQFTDGVAWDLADFAVAAVLLVGTGVAYKLVTGKAGNIAYRVAAGVAIGAALLLVWMNLAVGLIGSEDNAANLMYIGVLAVGFIGAIIARFQPKGRVRALYATALAQALVAVIALIAGMHQVPGGSVSEILYLNGVFVALFVASALLFRQAARGQHLYM